MRNDHQTNDENGKVQILVAVQIVRHLFQVKSVHLDQILV